MHLGRKAITSVLMTLILSGVVVSLLFLGVFYSYKKLSEDMGVEFSLKSLTQKPFFGYHGSIKVINISQKIENATLCAEECINEGRGDTTDCEAFCSAEYPLGNYSVWNIKFKYDGYINSRVKLDLEEDQFGLGVGRHLSSVVSDKLIPGMTGVFNVKMKIFYGCNSNISFKLSALDDPYVKSTFNLSSYDFCVGLPAKNVDVYLKDIYSSDDGTNYYITVDAGIRGKDVPELCPNATIYFFMANESNPIVFPAMDCASGEEYTYTIDTNNSNILPHWFDDNEKYRVEFNLTNDLPFNIDLSTPETADVILDLSPSRLGYEMNLTPDDVINSTAIVVARDKNGNYIDQETVSPLDRNVTVLETDANGYVTKVKIEFVLNSSISNALGGSTFTSGDTIGFFAYFNKTDIQLYPQSDTTQFYPIYEVNLSTGNFVNTGYNDADAITKLGYCANAICLRVGSCD